MPNSPGDVISKKTEALSGALKKHFRVASESVMSALKLCFLIVVLAMPALAQIGRNSPKSPQRLRRACAAVVTNGLIEVLPSRQLHS